MIPRRIIMSRNVVGNVGQDQFGLSLLVLVFSECNGQDRVGVRVLEMFGAPELDHELIGDEPNEFAGEVSAIGGEAATGPGVDDRRLSRGQRVFLCVT
jgi:hypothetical protein